MAVNVLARRYAKALFGLARDRNCIEEMQGELSYLAHALLADRKIIEFWNDPLMSHLAKRRILEAVFSQTDLQPVTKKFARLLLEKGRIGRIGEIYEQYVDISDAYKGVLEVLVFSAVELSDSEIRRLKMTLERKLGRKVSLVPETDSSVMGGLCLKINDYLYDGTVKGRLNVFLKEQDSGMIA